MPFATITGGSQTAEIRYGYGVLNRIQMLTSKLIPPSRLADLARSGTFDESTALTALTDDEMVGMMLGQLSNQVEIVKLVLISVKEGDKVVYTKGKDDPAEFVDIDLDPDLGAEIAKHLLGEMKTKGPDPNASATS